MAGNVVSEVLCEFLGVMDVETNAWNSSKERVSGNGVKVQEIMMVETARIPGTAKYFGT